MAKTPTRSPAKGFTIGRQGFAKISAVEGIRLSEKTQKDFRAFDQRGLAASKRRELISKKYGKDE